MVIDDDHDNRELIADVLRDEGFHVVAAKHGVEALDMLNAGYLPNLIILDVMMPVMDGFTFYHLKQGNPKYRAIPVIIISAAPDHAALDWVIDPTNIRAHQSPTIQKPFGYERLLDTVRRHVR